MDEFRCCIEVSGLKYAVSKSEVERVLRPLLPGFLSLSYNPGDRSGRAKIEMASREQATHAVRALAAYSDATLVYSPPGQNRTLRVQLAPSAATGPFVQTEDVQCWAFIDDSAMSPHEQAAKNENDMEELFRKLGETPMKHSLQQVVATKLQEGRVLKEMHLAEGRKCELVFAGSRGQKDTFVLRANQDVKADHLAEFWPLFDGLPADARRTGIDSTLHRISRTVHAVARRATGVTARIGRTIQGCAQLADLPFICGLTQSDLV